MADVITKIKHKIPEFTVYPTAASKLQEVLRDIPMGTVELYFSAWTADTGFEKGWRQNRGKKIGTYSPTETPIFNCVSRQPDNWIMWIYPARKTIIKPIKEALESGGYSRIQEWFSKQLELHNVTTTTRVSSSLQVTFEGQVLKFIE